MLRKLAAPLKAVGRQFSVTIAAFAGAGHAGLTPKPPVDPSARISQLWDEWLGVRARFGLVILALFESAYLLEVTIFEPKPLASATWFCAFDIAATAVLFGATYLDWFKRHWRGATMALCLAVIASRTLMGIVTDKDEPVLMALLAIVLGAAMLVPWDLRWQSGLSAAGLVSFTIASLGGSADSADWQRWPILALMLAFGLILVALKKHHLLHIERLNWNDNRLSRQIEELNAAQERFRAENERAVRLATIVNGCDDAIVGCSRELKITTWNPAAARIYGYPAGKAIGSGLDLFVPPEDLQRTIALVRQVLGTGQPVNFEQRARRADDSWFVAHVSMFPIRRVDGEIVGVASIGRDITSLKETHRDLLAAREAALAASRAKSEFLSGMSHEMRTPMNAILGMADLLSEDLTLNSEQRRYIEVMRSNGNALLHLINDVLDLAKIESGRLSLESLGFDLEELIDKTLETMGVRAHAKGLELTARILPTVPRNLLGDPLRLGQILINLLGNAIKFTDKGEVTLTVEALEPAAGASGDDMRLRFSVSDTGIGIAADKLDIIFSGFTRADTSISRRFGGTGLGLAIVARLTGLMNGTVEVESTPGRGSTFRVAVTLAVDPHPTLAASPAAPKLDGVRILIVDDNETNRFILRETLARVGAQPAEAASGEAGLAELARARAAGRPYGLMLLDYRMPGMDGAEVARRVLGQRQARKPGKPDDTMVLMLTSEDLNFQLARLRELSLHTCLIKPVKRIELLDTIGKLLRGVAPVHVRPRAGEPSPMPATERPLRILLAEDSPDNRMLIRAYFKSLPYALETAENGSIAIDKFKASPHDLVLMDVQMPVMDGLAATRAMRKWECEQGLAPTPILALTASALEEDVKRSLAAGCDAHVSKPVRKRVLLEAIHKAVGAGPIDQNATTASVNSSRLDAAPPH